MYKIKVQDLPVDGIVKPFQHRNATDIGCKDKAPVHHSVIKRFFSHPVPEKI